MASISCSDLSFSWPDGTVVLRDVQLSLGPGRTGLVGPNGCGKSTLLQLLTGALRPSAGSVSVDGSCAHLPQDLVLDTDAAVDRVLGIADVRTALAEVERGVVDQARLDVIGAQWDVEERARATLDRLGLGHVELDRRVGALSGGEAVLLGLASRLLARPDVLLLDEPTNNLDADRRALLHDAVARFGGVLLVVSHDRELLERMDRIAELRDGRVRLYGGAFSEYRAAVAAEQEAAARAVRTAEARVRREQRQRIAAQTVLARRQRKGRKQTAEARFPKIVAQERKRQAQVSAARLRDVHDDRLAEARQQQEQAQEALREVEQIRVDVPEAAVPARRTVLVAAGLNVVLPTGGLLWATDVDLDVRGPERIAVTGPNGGGKTTLLRCLVGEREPDRGGVRRGVEAVGYLPQRLDGLDPARSVLANVRRAAPRAAEHELRQRLARFAFRGGVVEQPAATLSGGERFRAALAMLLCTDPPPGLLVLDEPTNNLDLDSIAVLESALQRYRGALLVASHDVAFLDAVGISRRLRVTRQGVVG